MKRSILSILILAFCSVNAAEDLQKKQSRCGQGACCAARESSVLSMMGWGVGLFAGIAVLCSLFDNNPDKDSSSGQAHSHTH